jgi:hypothetical protein
MERKIQAERVPLSLDSEVGTADFANEKRVWSGNASNFSARRFSVFFDTHLGVRRFWLWQGGPPRRRAAKERGLKRYPAFIGVIEARTVSAANVVAFDSQEKVSRRC